MWNNNGLIIVAFVIFVILCTHSFLETKDKDESIVCVETDLLETLACESGCAMAYGFQVNDSVLDAPKDVGEKIIMCILQCNVKFYYREE